MLKLLVFPLYSIGYEHPVISHKGYDFIKDYNIVNVNWSNVTSNCSILFQQQILNNITLYKRLELECEQDTTDPCHKFNSRSIEYYDILYRDVMALKNNIHSLIYAIVLIYENEYYGHIYSWFDNDICYAIGIRSRPDILFMEQERKVSSIALKLLEGVRRLAVCKGYGKIVIPEPLGVMDKILDSVKFIEENGIKFATKVGLYNVNEITRIRYTDNVITPMIYEKISFNLIED